MYGVCAPERLRGALGEAEVFYFALAEGEERRVSRVDERREEYAVPDELGHHLDCLLNGHRRVGSTRAWMCSAYDEVGRHCTYRWK